MSVALSRLRLLRRGRSSAFAPAQGVEDRLSDLKDFGDNPGNLRARFYVPEGLEGPAPLVVVLHGCTQDAALYDRGSGWSKLADRHGFLLLFPEQRRANNPMLCFNWFSADDTRRGMGEAASIRGMIEGMSKLRDVDPERIFVTGLSAGGAMASAMLATYPEIFAGGAILAGVAYGCADDVSGAFDCMGGRVRSSRAELARSVRRASGHEGPWPRIQIWQGDADSTVVPSNAEAIVEQWLGVYGFDGAPQRRDEVEGFPRRAWLDAGGEPVIEHYSITGMAHGVPVASGGSDPIGAPGAHMLDVGLSSTMRIAEFFGIAPEESERFAPRPPRKAASVAARESKPESPGGAQAIIEKALKAAGLMR